MNELKSKITVPPMETFTNSTPPTVLKKSLPILIPSFANRCGTIGLNLLPIFLVDNNITGESAAFAISMVKSASILGIFLGGLLSDWLLLRSVILLSFLISGIGMLFLPFSHHILLICLFGLLSQLGSSMFPSSAQLMLGRLLPVEEQREAVGWLRMVNNLGAILSYTLGWIFGAAGPMGLMIFDSLTSFLAAGIGFKQLPLVHLKKEVSKNEVTDSHPPAKGASLSTMVMTVYVAAAFSFLFELFCTGAAAKMRVLFGARGVQYYSQIMIINTVLCTFLAIIAAKRLKNPAFALPTGLSLVTVGCLLLLSPKIPWMFLGALMWTLGEIFFMALSAFVLLRVTAHSKRSGTVFGTVTLVQITGRTLGGAAAFPLIISQWHTQAVILSVGISALAIAVFCIPRWKALRIAL